VLGVDKTASQQEIKKAYYLALQLHPDKNPGDEEAKEKFQQLQQKVVSILGDEEKWAIYDQTGCVDDSDLAEEVVNNLKEFFRTMLFCSMLCSDPKLDSHRFKDILDEAMAAGLKATKAYQKWAKKVSETKPPTSPLRCREKGEVLSKPTEEEFEAAKKKLESRNTSKKSRRK
ncbi:Chaperone protein like, partial [Actinidia chinensis var. chinensis]